MRFTRRRGAPVACGLAAVFALIGPVAPWAPLARPAAAAIRQEVVTGATTYAADPAGHVVHVTVDMTVEDVRPDTATTTYFLTGYRLGLQPEATNVRVTRGSSVLETTEEHADGYLDLAITFPSRVTHGHTQAFRVAYDLPDGGPRTSGAIRVAPGVAAFYAWSYGADQASVRILLPADCEPTTQGDPLQRREASGQVVLAADAIADRAAWSASVIASCPDALATTSSRVDLGAGGTATLDIRTFPDDPTWAATVRDRLTRGLPLLDDLVGLSWPVSGALEVTETYTPSLGGYAGFYEPPGTGDDDAHIHISDDPQPLVIIHEASHAWFNDGLFQERWIDEGLADTYAAMVLTGLGDVPPVPGTVQRDEPGSFALEDWPAPGPITDQATQAAEAYGYAASWTVMRTLVAQIGSARMRAVLQAAAAHQIAFVGRPAPETLHLWAGGVDWRDLLDLLEQVGGASDADALFSTWIVPADEASLLAAHTAATARYDALLASGDGWLPGYGLREPLAAWDFPLATTREMEAAAILGTRDDLDRQAAALGLAPPPGLRAMYEGATGDLAAVDAEATDELATVRALAAGHAAIAADHDPFVSIGLIGSGPGVALDAAGRAFTAGDEAAARADVALAMASLATAGPIGQQRVALVILALLAVLLLVAMVRRRWRRGRRHVVAIAAAATLAADRPTLEPSQPAPPQPGEGPPP